MALIQSSPTEAVFDRGTALVERDNGMTVVWLRGEHDVSTRPELARSLAGAIALDRNDLVVDLSEVQFLDASTIGVLVAAREFLRARSRSLALRSPSKFARRLLDVCGLGDLVEPRRVDAPTAGIALRSWVAVPATERNDHPHPTSSEPSPTPSPLSTHAPAAQQGLVGARHRLPDGAAGLAGLGRL